MLKLIPGSKAPGVQTLEEARVLIDLLWDTQLENIERIDRLEEKLRTGSNNSSKPPSQDSPAQRARRKKKSPTGRNKGAQPGHKKHSRVCLPESDVDAVHRFYPTGQCACGGNVIAGETPSVRHQVFDLPEVRYQVTEYQRYDGKCSQCGRDHKGGFPVWIPQGQMGAGLVSWISLVSGQYHLSIRQIQSLLEQQWQLRFSIGAISQAQRPVSGWLQPIYAQIGHAVRQSKVAHADETTHWRGSERRWLWTLCTERAVYFLTHYSRGKAAAKALLGDFTGILVTDRHGGYNDYTKAHRQCCLVHVLRNLEKMAQRRSQAGELGQRLTRMLRLLIRIEHRWRKKNYASRVYRQRLERLRQGFHETLVEGMQNHPKSRTGNQCKRLLQDEPMLWTFLQHPGIPLTNNTAERAIRPYVIWRKTSFFSQSYRGDPFRPLILSITETCKRLGIHAYPVLRKACEQGLRGDAVTVRLPIPKPTPLLI